MSDGSKNQNSLYRCIRCGMDVPENAPCPHCAEHDFKGCALPADPGMVPQEMSPDARLEHEEAIASAMAMARDDENEECAKICDYIRINWEFHAVAPVAAAHCAEAIRARRKRT